MIATAILLAVAVSQRPATVDLKRPASDAMLSVVSVIGGGAPLEWAGSQLAGGDLNGDGIQDLVVAAPGGSEDRPSRRGRLYIIYGSVTPRPSISLLPPKGAVVEPGAPDVVVNGADDFDHVGRALAVADFDGDGLADVAAGAPRADGPLNARPDCGEITILYGAHSLPRVIELGSPPAGVRVTTLVGAAPGDTLGASLAAADLSGDGIADLVAGAPLADGVAGAMGALDTGNAMAIVMERSMPAQIDLSAPLLPVAVALWSGRDAGDQAGSAVAAGDFNGDGKADIAVGARGADGMRNVLPESGEIYLMLGPGVPGGVLDDVATAVILAADVGDLAGSSLLMADLDGDGRDELIAGAETADGSENSRMDAGEAYVVAGRDAARLQAMRPPPQVSASSPSSVTQRLLASLPGGGDPAAGPVLMRLGSREAFDVRTLPAADPGDHLNVRAAGDLDGDGRLELILGAEDSSSRRNTRAGGGEVHVLMPDGRRIEIFGPAGGAHLGRAVCALDWDGDGRRELAVAAPQSGRTNSGRIWVLQLRQGL